MLENIKQFYGIKLGATDGPIGHVKDFYFDDQTWAVRYLVVDTGSWLPGRQVLLTPHAFQNHSLEKSGAELDVLPVKLTRQQIEDSPSIDSHRPVSRQYEEEYYAYYGWPNYWDGGMWSLASGPVMIPPPIAESLPPHGQNQSDDIHLRSTKSVTGYHIQATDGQIGSVSSFMVESESWEIREWVVEAGHWYAGKTVSLRSQHVTRISYEDSMVFVDLTKEDIEKTTRSDATQVGVEHR